MGHTETLLALTQPGLAVLVSLPLLLTWYFDRSQTYFLSFAAAFVLYGGGQLAQVLLWPPAPEWNATLSGVLFLATMLVFCHGLQGLAEVRMPWASLLGLAALALGVRLYLIWVHWHTPVRILVLHFSLMALLCVGVWRMRRLHRGLGFERALFWLVAVLAVGVGPLGLLGFAADVHAYGHNSQPLYWGALQAGFYLFSLSFVLLLLMAATSRTVVQLRYASYVDPLTRINNRLGFQVRMDTALRSARSYGLVILDVDHFKSINDRYGHAVGDQVLVHLAQSLQQHLRPCDIAARYGGEEFLILLPHIDPAAALGVAERLRLAVEALDFGEAAPGLACSASLGVGVFTADTPLDVAYSQADALLYQAKSAGRNRVSTGRKPTEA